ncbi:LOW QUALITY PROTEIN: DNA-binding protein RFX8 [Cariama cristata]
MLQELYMESCSPNSKCQVNPASFGKLIRLVFPGLGTKRLGTRGNTRCEVNLWQFSHKVPSWDGLALGLLEARRQSVSDKLMWTKVVPLANEYYSHCQDIWHMVRNSELDKVEDCIMSFWRSLQPERLALMSLPDVCQLFKNYDRQLFKEMENILLHDFLEEVPVQHVKSIRLLSKNAELWLLNALGKFPLPLQTSKCNEVTVFIKLTRKTDLSNLAKTMRTVLNSNSKVTVLRSDLHAVIHQGFLDVPGNLFQKKFRNLEELQNNIELKCLNDLMSLLAASTDIWVLHCVYSNLQAFVIQPSRSKEEFRKLVNFQLRWNFLLSAVSKAMTLHYRDRFGFRVLVDKAEPVMLTSHLV